MQRKKTKSHIRVHVRPPFRDKSHAFGCGFRFQSALPVWGATGVAFVLQFLGGERSRGMNLKRLAFKLQTFYPLLHRAMQRLSSGATAGDLEKIKCLILRI